MGAHHGVSIPEPSAYETAGRILPTGVEIINEITRILAATKDLGLNLIGTLRSLGN